MNFFTLVARNLWRRPVRTLLTILGVAVAILVFTALRALDHGVDRMVAASGSELVVTVFEKFKACPPYSRLPIHYQDAIASLPGVTAVMPVRIVLSNCQTTTDLVAVHGLTPALLRQFRELTVAEDEFQAFQAERGAGLVGRALAQRYGWRVGEQVRLAELQGISFVVRGIFAAPGSALENTILVDREYLERAINEPGQVTLFQVLLSDPAQLDPLCQQIDALFANAPKATRSGPERAFIASTIEDFQGLVSLAQTVAWTALGLLLIAVANSVSMSVRDRLRELAMLRLLGFRQAWVRRLLLTEAVVLATVAAALGCGLAALALRYGQLAISVEGYTIAPTVTLPVAASALVAGALLGFLGAVGSTWLAARRPLVLALREVD